jgi:tetraacyldisaccharide 4'-kinase
VKAPDFWQTDNWLARVLTPLGTLYGAATARRLRRHSVRTKARVICCGNATAGGTGKTILALAIADQLAAQGRRPMFLTRGYGGRLAGPVQVDPARHTAADVGDEALLLAARAPTIMARDRAAGAALAHDATDLILDDGLQNPDLIKDLTFLLIDGGAGFGNGRMIPAGPLREPVLRAAARVQAAILIGTDTTNALQSLPPGLPVLRAHLVPAANLAGTRVLGFAGIGRPEKFRASLIEAGADIADFLPFPDHHPYSAAEVAHLRARAQTLNAQLVTTEKDLVRLAPTDRANIMAVGVNLRFETANALQSWLLGQQ